MAAISISMLFVNSFINAYGEAASAVYGAGLKLQNIPSIITHGMSTANASMVGQNMAAGRPDRVRKSVHTCFVLNGIVYGVFILAVCCFPGRFSRSSPPMKQCWHWPPRICEFPALGLPLPSSIPALTP